MSILFLLLAGAVALAAQKPGIAVYIDLSGPWRASFADDPGFAAPGFDDSDWQTVPVPLGPPTPPRQPIWYRRTVPLPAEAENTRLALMIGSIPGYYEAYVDGVLVGRSGGSSGHEIGIARPRTFEWWHAEGSRAVVAVRRGGARLGGSQGWVPDDFGPWLLASPEAMPKQAGLHALAVQKLKRLGDLVQPLILICLATVILLVWVNQRQQRELLWLGLYCLLIAGTRVRIFTEIHPDSHPFGNVNQFTAITMALWPAALLAQFAATTLNVRWLPRAAWAAFAAGSAFVLFSPDIWLFLACLWLIQAMTLTALAQALARSGRNLLFVAGVCAVLYAHGSSYGRLGILGLPTLASFSSGGWISWHYSSHLIVLTVFAFVTTLWLVRRLLRDREDKVRLAAELEAARTVQQLMLPAAATGNSEYHIDSVYEPAQEVGGDFCFFEKADDGAILVLLGDVSGKGLRAAMIVSLIAGALRNRRSSEPAILLRELNTVLCRDANGGFVTCICLRLEPGGLIRAANAGHLAPWIDGREPAEGEHGLPLAIAGDASWSEAEWRMAPGSRLTLVSDGVVEASGTAGLFGFERVAEASGKGARDIAEIARAWGQNDDITVVTVRRAAA